MFLPVGTLNTNNAPVLRAAIVANSVALVVNDSVKAASGFIALGTTGALVFGHVSSIQTQTGVGLETSGVAGAETGSFVGAFTMASDNQTVAKVKAHCNISKMQLYSADPNAAIGTTTGSNLLGYFTDISDEDNTAENSATTTTCQYFIWGVDPEDSGNHIVNIYESQVLGV